MTKPLKKFDECWDGHGLKSPGHQTRTLCGPEILAVTAMAGEEEKVLRA